MGGIVLLAVYTGYTIKIYGTNQQTGQIAQQTYNSSQRAYIGMPIIQIYHGIEDKNGDFRGLDHRTPQTTDLRVVGEIKNFGPVPGVKFKVIWHFYVDGVEWPMLLGDQSSPTTIYPTQVVHLIANFPDPTYSAIMDKQKVLTVSISIDYYSPITHEYSCEKSQYIPDENAFAFLGTCG
jgi:hypothetical protein